MFLYPAVTFAAWWNPLTWKIFARQETAYNLEVQNIEATKRASEEKVNELQKQVEELRKQNSSSTATTTSLKVKSIDKNTTAERNLNKDIEQKNRELLIKRNLENQKNLEKAKIVTGSSVVPVSIGSDWYTYQDGSKFNTKTLETILSPEGQKKKWDEENRQADLRQIESNKIIAENRTREREAQEKERQDNIRKELEDRKIWADICMAEYDKIRQDEKNNVIDYRQAAIKSLENASTPACLKNRGTTPIPIIETPKATTCYTNYLNPGYVTTCN